MIVVKVELWPCGNESRAQNLGTLWVANVGGTRTKGEYKTATTRKGEARPPWPIYLGGNDTAPTVRGGEVKGYPRISAPVWTLVRMALEGLRF